MNFTQKKNVKLYFQNIKYINFLLLINLFVTELKIKRAHLVTEGK